MLSDANLIARSVSFELTTQQMFAREWTGRPARYHGRAGKLLEFIALGPAGESALSRMHRAEAAGLWPLSDDELRGPSA